MKHYASYALTVLLLCTAISGFSQNSTDKPKQFSAFPSEINCPELELDKIFNSAQGQQVNIAFSNNFTFSGTVTFNMLKRSDLHTTIITSTDYNNSIFTVSRLIDKDGVLSYTGRIINKNYFDGFELKKDQLSGSYQLNKVETDRVMPDCAKQ